MKTRHYTQISNSYDEGTLLSNECAQNQKRGKHNRMQYISTCLEWTFEILTILFCVSSSICDYFMMYQYYTHDKMAYFLSSLAIHLCYAIMFAVDFYKKDNKTPLQCCLCCCFMSLTFIVPFVSYITSFDQFKPKVDLFYLQNHGLGRNKHINNKNSNTTTNNNRCELQIWNEKVKSRHYGFTIDAFSRNLPLCLAGYIYCLSHKMEANVKDNFFNVLVVLSTTIGMINICLKLIPFATNTALFQKLAIFNWLAFSCTIFGILSLIAWFFGKSNNIFECDVSWIYISVILLLIVLIVGALPVTMVYMCHWDQQNFIITLNLISMGHISCMCVVIVLLLIAAAIGIVAIWSVIGVGIPTIISGC